MRGGKKSKRRGSSLFGSPVRKIKGATRLVANRLTGFLGDLRKVAKNTGMSTFRSARKALTGKRRGGRNQSRRRMRQWQ